MFIPVNGYGLSIGGQRRATGREEPKQFGPLSYVQYCVARNAERLGIDPASIVGYWPMWEGAGGRAWDVSSRGNHGILNDRPSWVNRGLNFNGSSDHISIPDFDNEKTLSVFGLFTSRAWDNSWLVNKRDGADDIQWQLLYHPDLLRASIFDGSNDIGAAEYTALNEDQQYHIGFVTNGVNTGYVKLFVDGAEVDSATLLGDMHIGTRELVIGTRAWDKDKGEFRGLMDGVRICNCVLTPDQIAFDYSHPYALLQPIPRPIFFDVGAIDAKGRLTVTFDSKSPDISFESKTPSIIFDGKGPRVTFK